MTSATEPSLRMAAQALARGDAFGALSLVGRMVEPLGLALRGIALAQLGDYPLARKALEGSLRAAKDARLASRVRAALVEVALGEGDAAAAALQAQASVAELTRLGDGRNAAMQRLVLARADVLLGRLGEARHEVAAVLAANLAPDVRTVACLAEAEVATRSLSAEAAFAALTRARSSPGQAPNPLLAREIAALERELGEPLAVVQHRGERRDVDLLGIERLCSGERLVVDGCRRLAVAGRASVPFARRPILFALLAALAEAFPADVPRDALAARAFEARVVNATHRARLRVEIGRLRKLLEGLGAEPLATPAGYALASRRDVVLLVPRTEDDASRIALLLGDGASWTAQRVAETAGISKRTALRALAELVEAGRAVRSGAGRNVRYSRPGTPIASRMLLLGLAPAVPQHEPGDTP